MASSCASVGLDWIAGKLSSLKEQLGIEQVAQGGGEITIPWKAQQPCGCGTWGYGLVASMVVLG